MNAILAALLLGAIGAGEATEAESLAPERPWDQYKILVERNAFSQTRGRKAAPTIVSAAPTPRPERYTVITGVVQQGDIFVALLEEVQGPLMKVAPGDAVAGGKVTEITLDGIVFEKDGKTTQVSIGSSLSLGPAPPGTVGVAPSTGGATGSSPKDLAISILERLRQRREQELGKQ